jgi:hypothetical protein
MLNNEQPQSTGGRREARERARSAGRSSDGGWEQWHSQEFFIGWSYFTNHKFTLHIKIYEHCKSHMHVDKSALETAYVDKILLSL